MRRNNLPRTLHRYFWDVEGKVACLSKRSQDPLKDF
ncbi:MAG: hypothetical protein LKKZDAJK_001757 [Candidatus Fervidibacter sp.]